MSQELLAKARSVVRDAQQRGAEGVRATLNRFRDSTVEWRDEQLDRIRESTTLSLSVTLFVAGRYSAHSTSDLRPAALERFLDETVAMTRLLAEDPHRRLPDPQRYANLYKGDLELYDGRGAAALTGVDRRRAAQALAEAARSAPGAEKIISVESSFSDAAYETAIVTSNGMEGVSRATSFVRFAQATVRDAGDRKPRGYSYAVSPWHNDLKAIESVGSAATRRALAGMGEEPMSTGRYPCVIENRIVSRVLGGLLNPLFGTAIQQQRSFLAEKLGERVASEALTLVDDPHVIRGLGSSLFDDEGMATHRRPIFERGVLRNFYLDTYYASKLGMEPTTGSTSNLTFDHGSRDLEGLLQAMGSGILITGFMGGNSNATTGDFSIGIRGHWIENGQRVRPLAEMNLAGNHLETWQRLVEVGNDPWLNSSRRCPSMRFDELQFAGA